MISELILVACLAFLCSHGLAHAGNSDGGGPTFSPNGRAIDHGSPRSGNEVSEEEPAQQVPFDDEQRAYLSLVFKTAIALLQNDINVAEAERTFGPGEYFWPKDPQKPVKVRRFYRPENFRGEHMDIILSRDRQDQAWRNIAISVRPQNFPRAVFATGLPRDFFDGFAVVRRFSEHSPTSLIKHADIFILEKRANGRTLRIRTEARSDVSNPADNFPRNVHIIVIEIQ